MGRLSNELQEENPNGNSKTDYITKDGPFIVADSKSTRKMQN